MEKVARSSLGTLPLLAALVACGGGPGVASEPPADARSVRGLKVIVESDAPFTRAPDFEDRLQSTIELSLRYWGGSWSMIEGRNLRIVDAAHVECGGRETLGCFDGAEIRITSRDPGLGTVSCVEQTVLVHEIGHVVRDDPDHTDPRWMEMGTLAAELSGRDGYVPGGVTSCMTHVNVWRHPLGTP